MRPTTTHLTDLDLRRKRLGMTKRTVSKRSGVSVPTVDRILSGRESRPRLDNVQAIARALGVEVRLGETVDVVETHTAHEFQKARAEDKARRLVGMVQANMALEDQAVDSATMHELVEQTAAELLTGPRRRLWDD